MKALRNTFVVLALAFAVPWLALVVMQLAGVFPRHGWNDPMTDFQMMGFVVPIGALWLLLSVGFLFGRLHAIGKRPPGVVAGGVLLVAAVLVAGVVWAATVADMAMNERWIKTQIRLAREMSQLAHFVESEMHPIECDIPFPSVLCFETPKGWQIRDSWGLVYTKTRHDRKVTRKTATASVVLARLTKREVANVNYSQADAPTAYSVTVTACVLACPGGEILSVKEFVKGPPDFVLYTRPLGAKAHVGPLYPTPIRDGGVDDRDSAFSDIREWVDAKWRSRQSGT